MEKKRYVALFIFVIAVAAWGYAFLTFHTNKEQVFINLAEMFDDIALPYRLARLELKPRDTELLLPFRDIRVRDVEDTWGAARADRRTHEGTDMFAKRGTPIYSATYGYVIHASENELGGKFVTVAGAGGYRYYYAHLDSIAVGIERGDEVTVDTVLGFAGNTGNASNTPVHLHFGMYSGAGAENPYPFLANR